MLAIQGKRQESVVRLVHLGSPVLGVLPAGVVVTLRRSGDESFTLKLLDADSWKELADGYYAITWSADEMGVTGPFLALLTGATFDQVNVELSVWPVPVAIVPPDKCVIYGNVLDLRGAATVVSNDIVFRLTRVPMRVGDTLMTGHQIITRPDAHGNFSAALVRGAEVVVDIDFAGIHNKFTVPEQETAALLSLLPPL